MADATFVISELLCFILHYYKKQPVKLIKTMLIDFYSSTLVTAAKELLMADVARLDIANTPRIPSRRSNDTRTKLEIDDIITLITFADENGFIAQLPRYVAATPELLP